MGELVTSVAGALMGSAGSLALNWRTTVARVEQTLVARQCTCVAIDETNSSGVDAATRARIVCDVVFLVAEGVTKGRFNDPEVSGLRLALLSTANMSVPEAARRLRTGDVDLEALAARLLTIPIEAGAGLGCWDTLPAGFDGPGQAVNAFREALGRHHGWALERFLKRLAEERRRDEAALRALLLSYVERFLAEVRVPNTDGVGSRRAVTFAIIYAAGRLACEWRVLPFAAIGKSIQAVYERAEAQHPPPALVQESVSDRIRRYLAKHREQIIDLDAASVPELSDSELEGVPGFFKTIDGRRCLLLRSGWLALLLATPGRTALRELRASGRLVAKAGFHVQTRVRKAEDKVRVYAIELVHPATGRDAS